MAKKKKSQKATISKTVKYYNTNLDSETKLKLQEIGARYIAVKNYIYSRYSGIRSMGKIRTIEVARKEIRDKLMEEYNNAHKYDEIYKVVDSETGKVSYKKCQYR